MSDDLKYTAAQLKVIRTISSRARARYGNDVAKRRRYEEVGYEIGRVESNFTNLAGGDADSVNYRQERTSIYGGDMNLTRITDRMFDEMEKADHGQSVGELAADIQRPRADLRGRYGLNIDEARRLADRGTVAPSPRSTHSTTPVAAAAATAGVDEDAAMTDALLDHKRGGSVLKRYMGRIESGNYATETPTPTVPVPVSPDHSATVPPHEHEPAGLHGSHVLELIYNDGGKGYGIKNGATVDGASVFAGVWDGHKNHVHVAAGPKTIVELGKLAESMDLHVGENPHFGGVTPVHVADSYHYKGQAIDVSGDAHKMAAFAKAVAAYNRDRAHH